MKTIELIEIDQMKTTGLFAVTVDDATFYNVERVEYKDNVSAAVTMRGPDGNIIGVAGGKINSVRTVIRMRWIGEDDEGYPVPPALVYSALVGGMGITAPPESVRIKMHEGT